MTQIQLMLIESNNFFYDKHQLLGNSFQVNEDLLGDLTKANTL